MYTLNFANNSSSDGTFVVFQIPNETNLHSLAWKTLSVRPFQRGSVSWKMDYGFVCGECSSLKPGVLFKSDLIVPTSLSSGNEINCTPINGKCNFDEPRDGDQDMFTIIEMDDIPMHKLALGISVSSSPIFVAEAEPTSQLDIPEMNKKYYVAFGSFQEGEVLDSSSLLRSSAMIEFKGDNLDIEVNLEADGTWSVFSDQETAFV